MVVTIVVVLALIITVVVAISAFRQGERSGAENMREHLENAHGDSLFFGVEDDTDAIVRSILDVLRSAAVLLDDDGRILYSSPNAIRLGLSENGRLAVEDIENMLMQVRGDHRVRTKEFHIDLRRDRRARRVANAVQNGAAAGGGRNARRVVSSGAGVAPGQSPVNDSDRWLQVCIGPVAGDRYLVLVDDTTQEKHFEQMRRDFVTNVSHELKTPSGAIQLLSETVSDASDDPDAVRYFAGRINKESKRLSELIASLIELERAQSGTLAGERVPVPMVEVVNAAVGENQTAADAKHIELKVDVSDLDGQPAARSLVMGNRESLKSAIKNLVENAVRYSNNDTHVGIIVRRGSRNETVPGARDENGEQVTMLRQTVVVRVVDQGIGIPQESLSRIFERFYRVDPARSRATGGTGLGLSIVKHVVQDVGGTISVWSRQGEGTTFTVELPVASPSETGADEDDAHDDGRAHDGVHENGAHVDGAHDSDVVKSDVDVRNDGRAHDDVHDDVAHIDVAHDDDSHIDGRVHDDARNDGVHDGGAAEARDDDDRNHDDHDDHDGRTGAHRGYDGNPDAPDGGSSDAGSDSASDHTTAPASDLTAASSAASNADAHPGADDETLYLRS